MWSQVLEEFTLSSFIVHIIFSLIITALERLLMPVFKVSITRERLFWVANTLLVLCVLTVVQVIARNSVETVDIRPEVQWVDIADVSPTNSQADAKPGFTIKLIVRNPGMPTVIDWRAEVTWPTREMSTLYPAVQDGQVLHLASGDVKFGPNDQLLEKTKTPIVHGGMVEGVLPFVVAQGGFTRQDVMASKIVLIARDVRGIDHRIDTGPRNH